MRTFMIVVTGLALVAGASWAGASEMAPLAVVALP